MPNFFTDNRDILFNFEFLDLEELANLQEDDFKPGELVTGIEPWERPPHAPINAADAVDNFRRILEITGQVAAEVIAPNAEEVDEEGNTLNEDGTVTYHPKVQENLDALAQGDLMGFTLPHRFGGLNCPNVIYTMATEIVSRGDGSLMNLFGLQGIAETINAFASEEIRQETLHRFCRGEVTGAMVLTEPDAGSDLQAIRLRADLDENGQWRLNGVKRFITNGCGEILLTLARSEPHISDGRGLSLFYSERSEHVKVRHLEHKMGIHGSPTCELVYTNAPAKLVGERQRGLIEYVMALMNGARLGIAAQSLGIAEAAYRLARTYAHTRQQFGVPIERFPAVAELVTDMQVYIEAARALAYQTAFVCDHENNALRVMEMYDLDKDKRKEFKQKSRHLRRLNGMLTPMSKYYCSEMSCDVAYDTIQVLGGSGYMKDYPAERYARDARITTIYEGTSQLQILAASRAFTSGVFNDYATQLAESGYDDPLLSELREKLVAAQDQVAQAVAYVKGKSPSYLDLSGRRLVDCGITVICGHFLLKMGAASERKKRVARRYIESRLPELEAKVTQILSGDVSPVEEYELLAGPVPVTA